MQSAFSRDILVLLNLLWRHRRFFTQLPCGKGPAEFHFSEVKILANEKVLQEKQALVDELSQKLNGAVAGVIVEYKGISVADDTLLRRKLREAGVDYSVVKNTMLRRAADKAGLEGLDDILKGTTALAVSAEDPVAAAKILCEQAKKDENFKVKAGFLDGAVIDVARVTELSKLPSREGLISMLLSVLTGPVRGLAVALNAIAEKQGEGAEAPAAE